MAFFAVLPTTDNEKMKKLINSTFEEKDIKRLPNNCYLIDFHGTSAEFVNKLNLSGNPKIGTTENRPCEGVIIPFMTYAGFADSEIWNWLNSRRV